MSAILNGIGGAQRWFVHDDVRIKLRIAYHPLYQISTPTQFEHKSHIGFNAEGKFDVRNLPTQWKGTNDTYRLQLIIVYLTLFVLFFYHKPQNKKQVFSNLLVLNQEVRNFILKKIDYK